MGGRDVLQLEQGQSVLSQQRERVVCHPNAGHAAALKHRADALDLFHLLRMRLWIGIRLLRLLPKHLDVAFQPLSAFFQTSRQRLQDVVAQQSSRVRVVGQ